MHTKLFFIITIYRHYVLE